MSKSFELDIPGMFTSQTLSKSCAISLVLKEIVKFNLLFSPNTLLLKGTCIVLPSFVFLITGVILPSLSDACGFLMSLNPTAIS